MFPSDIAHFSNLWFKPQNIESGMSNVEGKNSKFCGSLFDIRYSIVL